MTGRTFTWTVPRDVFDHLNHLTAQMNNGLISQVELVEQMRSYGFPADATPGDHVHIRFADREVALVNGLRDAAANNAMRHNGKRVLPGLPH